MPILELSRAALGCSADAFEMLEFSQRGGRSHPGAPPNIRARYWDRSGKSWLSFTLRNQIRAKLAFDTYIHIKAHAFYADEVAKENIPQEH